MNGYLAQSGRLDAIVMSCSHCSDYIPESTVSTHEQMSFGLEDIVCSFI